MKWVIYLLFAAAFVLISFFGLGPILIADGSDSERFMTLAVVILLYIILIGSFVYYLKRKK